MKDIWSKLSKQSLGRALSNEESDFSDKLEAIFLKGTHDFQTVAKEFNLTLPEFEAKLKAYNRSLDAAYQDNGLGA